MASTSEIKALRDETGLSIMQCKEALENAGGDVEKARELLREKGAKIAAKKADRELGSGVVSAYVHSNGRLGAMVELDCETDFVSGNEEFKTLARDIAMHITASAAEDVEGVLAEAYIKNPDQTIEQLIQDGTQKFGEKIVLARFARYNVLG